MSITTCITYEMLQDLAGNEPDAITQLAMAYAYCKEQELYTSQRVVEDVYLERNAAQATIRNLGVIIQGKISAARESINMDPVRKQGYMEAMFDILHELPGEKA